MICKDCKDETYVIIAGRCPRCHAVHQGIPPDQIDEMESFWAHMIRGIPEGME